MASAPRYAFVTLEPGLTKREVFMNLSLYGDVRIMTTISEVSALVTDLVKNLEITAGPVEKYISPIVETLPSTRPVSVSQRSVPVHVQDALQSGLVEKETDTLMRRKVAVASTAPTRRLGKRAADKAMPEPLPRAPPNDIDSPHNQPVLRLPTFGGSPDLAEDGDTITPMEQLQRTLKESQEMLTLFKTEEDPLDLDFGANQPLFTKNGDDDLEIVDSKDGIIERQYEQQEEMEEPSSSAMGVLEDEVSDDLRFFMDDEGNIEVPPARRSVRVSMSRTPSRTPLKSHIKEEDMIHYGPPPPKRFMGSFFHFLVDRRPALKKEGMSVGEIAKTVGAAWKKLEDKSPWEELAAKDKMRYDAEMEIYRAEKAQARLANEAFVNRTKTDHPEELMM